MQAGPVPSYLPISLRSFTLWASVTLRAPDLVSLATSLPLPEELTLGADIAVAPEDQRWKVSSAWKLKVVRFPDVRGSADPLVHWLGEASSTLTTFELGFCSVEYQGERITHSNLLLPANAPFPHLHTLMCLNALPPLDASELLQARKLPALEVLATGVVDQNLSVVLRVLPVTLRRVHLVSGNPPPHGDTTLTDQLATFIENHPALEALALEFHRNSRVPETAGADATRRLWSEVVEDLCAERGILFATNEDKMWQQNLFATPASADEDGEDAQNTGDETIRVGNALDFDDEDDAMWAHLWSEEKRIAMGIGESAHFWLVCESSRPM